LSARILESGTGGPIDFQYVVYMRIDVARWKQELRDALSTRPPTREVRRRRERFLRDLTFSVPDDLLAAMCILHHQDDECPALGGKTLAYFMELVDTKDLDAWKIVSLHVAEMKARLDAWCDASLP